MAKIPFSFDENNWQSVDDNNNFGAWINTQRESALMAVHGGTCPAFTSVIFQSNDIIEIFKIKDAKLGLYPILCQNKSNEWKCMLVAVRLTANEKIDSTDFKACIGPPAHVSSNGIQISGSAIKFVSNVNGLNWERDTFQSIDIADWLTQSKKQEALQKNVDLMSKVVFELDEIKDLLIENGLVAFSLVIRKCNFDPNLFDLSGECCYTFNRYSCLMINKIAQSQVKPSELLFSEAKFLISGNVWRPNYPPTIKKEILLRIRLLEARIDLLKHKLFKNL